MTPPTTSLVSWLSIPEFGDDVLQEGWPHFIETHLHREIEWFAAGGVRQCRFVLHNPGFVPAGEAPAFDQWLKEDGNLPRLRDEFAEAWRPVVEAGHEVICYLGPLRWIDPERDPYNDANLDNPRFGELVAPFRTGEWLQRTNASLAPAVAARCSIAFDSLGQVTPLHPAYHLVALLRSTGTRCYVEPVPLVADDYKFAHWYATPKIVMEEKFDRQNQAAGAKNFSEEVIRVCTKSVTSPETEVGRIARILADGHTAAFRVHGSNGVNGAADLGVTCGQLLAAATPVSASANS